jgi:carbon-monoxide dehydrogenase medium subunit
MIPAPCRYVRPSTIAEALTALEDPDAKVLAGGHSLLPMMKLRLARPSVLVDVVDVIPAGVRQLDDTLRIGAGTTYDELLRSDAGIPAGLREAARSVGDLQVRNAGTLGGALAHADPACDIAAPLISLNARLRLESLSGEREVATDSYFLAPYTTLLKRQELLMEIILPNGDSASSPSAYVSFDDPASGYPIVGVALGAASKGGSIASCVVGLTGCGPTPIRAAALESALLGDAGASVSAAIDELPLRLKHEDAPYRRHLLAVATTRAFASTVQRAGGRTR